jgi:HK97 family phage portal protein
MITSLLIRSLQRARRPWIVRALAGGLELWTGRRTHDLVAERKGLTLTRDAAAAGSSESARWYIENGYPVLADALGGFSSATGRSITAESALESSAVFACVKILSEDIGALPFFLYEHRGDQLRRAVDHPLYELLHDMPNPETTSIEFMESLTAQSALTGNGYARIARNGAGRVIALWQFADGSMRMERKEGNLYYVHRTSSGRETIYGTSEILHLKGFTLNGISGDNVVRRARQVLGLTLTTQEYAAKFFANDAGAGIYIQRPLGAPRLDAQGVAHVKEAWAQWHQGSEKWHRVGVLQEGATVTRLDPDHQKLQLVDQRKFQVLEVCRLFRMPPHKLADLDRATFANIEHQAIEYVTNTLRPWLTRWRQAIHRCVLTPEERPRYFAEHSVEALLRGDFRTQSEGFARLLEKGVYSINEVRAWLNLNPVEGGDKHYVQLNMQAVADAASGVLVSKGIECLQ